MKTAPSKNIWCLTVALTAALSACGPASEPQPVAPTSPVASAPAPAPAPTLALDDDKTLNLYLLPDYLPETLVADFERETGVKVNVQNFENYETLNAKLVAGQTGFDLVIPGNLFAKSLIEAGLLKPLDRSLLPLWNNQDPAILQKMEAIDPGNRYLATWAWGYTGVGINRTLVDKALGGQALPENAWELLFNPRYTRLLKSCGIAYLDSPHRGDSRRVASLGPRPIQSHA